jgi:(1->4)-alpha-D-glucan 1-alpha-D-glucosylmutase
MRIQSAPLTEASAEIVECLDRLASERSSRPVSTYRLQFNENFKFTDAVQLADYLRSLGVSTFYSSPLLKARAGSTHGYDIIDHNTINPEIGTEEEFAHFIDELRAKGMNLLIDTVPNHMGVGHGTNPWWQDVLENGQASRYAEYFDIDWTPLKQELQGKVLLPILGSQYGEELESGHLCLELQDGRFILRYYDKVLQIDPQTYPFIFAGAPDFKDAAALERLRQLMQEFGALPRNTNNTVEARNERSKKSEVLRQELGALLNEEQATREYVERQLHILNGKAGDPHSFDSLHGLLEAQAFRLAHWRVSGEEINYRRFFDINDLIGLRMEDPRVFAATHKLIRKLLATGTLAGLRVDHPDGLFNPLQYFTRLQMLFAASRCCGAEPLPPLAENGIELEVQTQFGQHGTINKIAPLYVLVEKILEPGEHLPQHWPVDGTVGYEFGNLVNGLWIDSRQEKNFTKIYERFIRAQVDVPTLIYRSKMQVMHTALASEVGVLSHMLDEISSNDRHARDFTRKVLRDTVRETIAWFPVYRTYIDERGEITDRDRKHIEEAISRAKRSSENISPRVFDFLQDILLLRGRDDLPLVYGYRKQLYFTLKFQQLTGPVMAKGLEDTACYVYNRLISVNEVGGSPGEFGNSIDEFHAGNLERRRAWPHSMLTTSTHDTKRSEDVRARINVLTEMPRQWSAQVMRWRRANNVKRTQLADGRIVPDANEEYLLYQTLVGSWPLEMNSDEQRKDYRKRIQQYMTKAVHEAKVNLSWVNQDPAYVEALHRFIAGILKPTSRGRTNRFLEGFEEFIPKIEYFGALNSLAQLLLKITAPGMPDIYQGQELWDLSLVDPDNRRKVDFELRQRYLRKLEESNSYDTVGLREFLARLAREWRDGRLKMWTTMRALCFRKERQHLFQNGSYVPLFADEGGGDYVVAFARVHEKDVAITAVPRLAFTMTSGEKWPLGEAWKNARISLPEELQRRFANVLTGENVSVEGGALNCASVFATLPIALLKSE